ncbi:holliday junction DNA helicase RuvA [Mycoplasmopsis californica HAZ160_1]|uniref:Holliday junction branch migration complex subunit RuvA n=2 Tax=Mycoplasmopsis californica TaxID=2113 RepID=A0A059XLK1_9BACT|nr:Holliday junction branch migration protein RuvA [Mycoplasmopsis californica]AIA29409.1 Holliday junction DNA helicase RuvA [Mycoplasmopsis californica]BAP01141.1 holliday junction DNA helicase RuvA [Mycoplasmopsis californica HAZ160_1]BBG41007.1 holliday junction DNA helicase RuvA [Mycoplasmopsis californica]BBG41600.1 holliday junction DNA helicase RuvA [Mycoplasmopsis californica]BBG42194.1 holliday junction DNA helicase RuvA [Mycoplasmopsis californica]
MILYRIGEIVYKNGANLIFESSSVGYNLIMPNSERVEAKTKLKLYLFEINNDYYKATYAFKDFKERLLFADLIALNGVGPKVAFNMLNNGWEKMASMIALGDLDAISKTPYLNAKVARLAVAELSDKWSKIINTKKASQNIMAANTIQEAKETLKILGFKTHKIDEAMASIDAANDVETIIEQAMHIMTGKSMENENSNFASQ